MTLFNWKSAENDIYLFNWKTAEKYTYLIGTCILLKMTFISLLPVNYHTEN